MAHLTSTTAPRLEGRAIANLLADLRRAVARRRAFVETRNALQALTNRDLDDLGIVRGDIVRIAREAADRI